MSNEKIISSIIALVMLFVQVTHVSAAGKEFANAIGTLSGATSVILATIRLMQAVNYSGVYSAHQAGKTLANVDYVIAYQGSWYTYSVSEPGWSSNYIYTPAAVYGTGTLYSY